jgi:hypothetical protein
MMRYTMIVIAMLSIGVARGDLIEHKEQKQTQAQQGASSLEDIDAQLRMQAVQAPAAMPKKPAPNPGETAPANAAGISPSAAPDSRTESGANAATAKGPVQWRHAEKPNAQKNASPNGADREQKDQDASLAREEMAGLSILSGAVIGMILVIRFVYKRRFRKLQRG